MRTKFKAGDKARVPDHFSPQMKWVEQCGVTEGSIVTIIEDSGNQYPYIESHSAQTLYFPISYLSKIEHEETTLHQFKPGDKVRLRKDMKAGDDGGQYHFTHLMEAWAEDEIVFTITAVMGAGTFELDEDERGYGYHSAWFILVRDGTVSTKSGRRVKAPGLPVEVWNTPVEALNKDSIMDTVRSMSKGK
jgi:hypothetical protein